MKQTKPKTSGIIAVLRRMLLACFLCLASGAFADSPPEVAGTFTRSDGVAVKAMKWEVSGVIGYSGTNCWFELPGGKRIPVQDVTDKASASPNKWERGCVIRITNSAAEIYRFKSDAFPVATRVLYFDGYAFKDVTTTGKRWLSPLIHTWEHLGDYLVPAVFFALLAFLHWIGKQFVKPKPERGWWLAIRAVWLFCYALTALICAFLLLFVVTGWGSPTSPWVFLVLFAVGFVLYRRLTTTYDVQW